MYSQQKEQIHILAAVKGTSARFLDIGAWHPKTFSNTRALYELGWGGVMVEPSPEPFLTLLKEYGNEPRVTLINAAVGLDRGLISIHATADAVSTTDEATFRKWQSIGGYYGSFYTSVIHLDDLFTVFGRDMEFVSIDAEGGSVDLLLRLFRIGRRPRCICVEYDDRLAEAKHGASEAGYRITHDNGTNLVMVHGE